MSRKRQLEARRAAAIKGARDLTNAADAANRDLSAEEQTQFDAHMASAASLKGQIAAEEALALEEAGMNADRTVDLGAKVITGTTDNAAADPKGGFKTFGEYASAVQREAITGSRDKRLVIGASAPGTSGNEASGTDGGFLVPPEFSAEIFNLSLAEDSLLPLVDNVTVGGNSMVFPKDETTPWGTDGVRAYWQSENSAATATKPKFGVSTMRLHKLMALVPLSDELLADTSALNSYLPNLMSRSIRWKTNEALIKGSGAGQPLGMFNAANASMVVVAKESGQAASTIQTQNLLKMIARLPPGSFPKSQWLITPDALPALFGLTLGNYPIYLPTNQGMQGSPYGTLLGRPINVSQHAEAFSSQGDIELIDPTYYRALTKAGGIETASSMHLYFDADATAFRATFRVDGQPKLAAPIAQAKGSNTLSPFVQLGAR